MANPNFRLIVRDCLGTGHELTKVSKMFHWTCLSKEMSNGETALTNNSSNLWLPRSDALLPTLM